ncbi:hypothetical protein chiPu_0028868, partial [Chiloscyllium punctatum]|nr:hypothetical protein [Chiloscyllium punctatum]
IVAQVRDQHHSEIERAVDERAFQHVARRLEQLDRDAGKAGLEPLLVTRQEIARHGIGDADADRAEQWSRRYLRVAHRLGDGGEDLTALGQEAAALHRYGDAVRRAFQQARADGRLELLNRRGDCGLRDVEVDRRLADAPGLGGGDEVADLFQRNGHRGCSDVA